MAPSALSHRTCTLLCLASLQAPSSSVEVLTAV